MSRFGEKEISLATTTAAKTRVSLIVFYTWMNYERRSSSFNKQKATGANKQASETCAVQLHYPLPSINNKFTLREHPFIYTYFT